MVSTNQLNLKLSKDVLDVSETALGNFKVFLKCSAFEDWLRGLTEELHERKELSYLLDVNHLFVQIILNKINIIIASFLHLSNITTVLKIETPVENVFT